MRYQVPKFLDRQSKFFNLFTFKQLAILGGIGVVMFILYYIVPKTSFFILLFLVGAVIIAFTFVRIEGFSLSQIVLQSFGYLTSSKKFQWQKKGGAGSPILIQRKVETNIQKDEPLKISPKSRIGKLSSHVEMGFRDDEER